MALFGPRDRTLPLLTQLYQVEEDNIAEMDAMLNLRRGLTPFGMEGAEEQAEPVMRLHKLARRLMDRAIDGEAQMGDIWEFNRLWTANVREFGFLARPNLVEVNKDILAGRHTFATTVFPLDDLTMARYNFNDPWRDFETEIVHEVAEMLRRGGKDLARCPQCENVFVVSRAGKRFCSQRCQNRAGVRRMAARKKSSKESSRTAVFR